MEQFVLRFTGAGAASEADLERIRSAKGLTVLDASPRMLLVRASPETIDRLAESLPGWAHSPEQMIPVPDPRPKIRPQ